MICFSQSHEKQPVPASSAPDQAVHNQGWIVQYGWLVPIVIAVAVFSVSLRNYFSYDDFVWLNRARTFNRNWLQMLRPDVAYFDPLVHLSFWLNYLAAGLDNRWYHALDLAIHAANSFLVYRFARLLSGDEKIALFGSTLFASSFAIVDAVVWPSSRVDLISTFFSLGVLIQFECYLRSCRKKNLIFAIILFIMALCAKGTPLILPLVLFWLIIQKRKAPRYLATLVTFGLIAVVYLLLLKLSIHKAALPLDRWHFNLQNLPLAFSALFIPEEVLNHLNVWVTGIALFAMAAVLVYVTQSDEGARPTCRTGFILSVAAILPVIILKDLKLATDPASSSLLLLSPSHRIYLASVGSALLCGGLLRYLERLAKVRNRSAVAMIALALTATVIANVFFIIHRNKQWESAGSCYRIGVNGLLAYRGTVAEGSQIGLVNFTGSRGFLTPMLNLCLQVEDITIIKDVVIGMIEAPEILKKAEHSHLFIIGVNGQTYDKSVLFRKQLHLNKMANEHPEHPEYQAECLKVAEQLDKEIAVLFPKNLDNQK